MPKEEKKQAKRLAFLADRMALLMLELVRRDFDFGRFCHEEFYTDEIAGYLQQGRDYQVCLDFVRMMIQKHDKEQKNELGSDRREQLEGQDSQGLAGEGEDGDGK